MAKKDKAEIEDEKEVSDDQVPARSRKKTKALKGIKDEALQAIYAIVALTFAILLILSAIEKAGPLGNFIYVWLTKFLGTGYFLLPLVSVALAISLFRSITRELNAVRLASAIILVVSLLGMIDLTVAGKGGLMGFAVTYPLLSLLGVYASWVILLSVSLAAALILANTNLPVMSVFKKLRSLSSKKIEPSLRITGQEKITAEEEKEEIIDLKESPLKKLPSEEDPDEEVTVAAQQDDSEPLNKNRPPPMRRFSTPFSPPPLTLLERDRGKPEVGDVKANANIIKRTLQNFGINVEMDEVSIGPSVTRYALKPAEGVKLSKIVALNNDLALALAAHPIRIEAPIPGKSLVGIEIPNTTKTTVGLATLFSASEFGSSDKALLVTLGKGITGKSHFADLAKMPHLLVAGATGSGKSVSIHVMINSLLFRNSPENLKFIMIDPKRVELTLYNKIPHLLAPVITDPKKAILALKWATKEMERRYNILEQESVRDISSYHKNVLEPALEKAAGKSGEENDPLPETMPYLVIVIDELADIMQTYPRELESAIVRLAQMSRAVGIHLILSTQRPSVNVITGLIKANVPARVALQVASQIDSRTILDSSGAEKLLGAGDMLYLGAEMSKPVRLQSPFISETEVKKVVKHLADQYRDELISEIDFADSGNKNSLFEAVINGGGDDEDADELYEEAREIVVGAGKASTSYLQRKLKVGYARAARLMDILEERGVIGPADGAKPRSVLGMEGMGKTDGENPAQ